MNRVIIFFLVLTLAYSQIQGPTFEKYQKFMQQYKKTYESFDEMNKKYVNFEKNLNMTPVSQSKGNSTKLTEFTKFLDLSPEEFKKQFLKLNHTQMAELNNTKKWYNITKKAEGRFLQDDTTTAPDSFDWRDKGAVNDVQNQGVCGGCWAFSSLANLEGVYFVKYGILPKFAEQQLIDCDGTNSGCSGGIMGNAYDYMSGSGIMSESNYPYVDGDSVCQFNTYQANNVVNTWTSSGTDDEEQIKQMLFTTGPLAVTINGYMLQYYTGGVINVGLDVCPYAPNHGVNLVGYGTDETGIDYWIVRNTWGADWGENGYFRLARGFGLCGINQYVVSAIVN